ncbi:MAG TPA: DUF1761 domain-containing protein [Actinomycetota bacterium]|nr:DUF1761 domain-containing protein [Actinomycetota bacterium]
MNDLNYLATGAAALAAFVLSSVYYGVFGKQLAELNPAYATDSGSSPRPPTWKMLVEVVRSLAVASVLAGLAAELDIVDWTGAVVLGFTMWIGFPIVLWTGAVMWEKVPWKLATIHAGDWLMKLLLIAVVASVWS